MDNPSTSIDRYYPGYDPGRKKIDAVRDIVSGIISKKNEIYCPTPEELILDYVLKNKTKYLEKLFNANLLKCRYSHPVYTYYVDILSIACVMEEVKAWTVECLIKMGADIRCRDVDSWEPLHYAALRSDYPVLKDITDELKNRRFHLNEILVDNNNALDILFSYGNKDSVDFVACAKLLIDEGINVNLADNNKITFPSDWANTKKLKDIRKDIQDYYDQITRGTEETVDHEPDQTDPNDCLFELIKKKDEDGFLNYDSAIIVNLADSDNGKMTLLQFACENRTKRIVERLLKVGADKTKTTTIKKETPIEIAADRDYHEIFEILIDQYKENEEIPKYVISEFLPRLLQAYDSPLSKYKSSCDLLLKKLKANRNIYDLNEKTKNTGYTPLHYAARYADTATVIKLVEMGASLDCRNESGFMPVQYLDTEQLEAVLDNCVQGDLSDRKRKIKEFKVSINFSPLLPKKVETKNNNTDPSSASMETNNDIEIQNLDNNNDTTPESINLLNSNNVNKSDNIYETDLVFYMSGVPEFKHLLKHPVVASFLYLKWHSTRWLFWANLAFYLTFCAFLVINVFLNSSIFQYTLLWFILSITLLVLAFREVFQMCLRCKKYFKNVENYMELLLIGLVALILLNCFSTSTQKAISSLSMLLAGLELILMIGQHPNLSTNLVILRTVSYNFFKFLLCYVLLILAFPLSFYIIFAKDPQELSANNTKEDDADPFENPGLSLFQTIVMLTGELNANDLRQNFEKFPIIGRLIFVIFIFMIVIILLNLLNGLAVSDTQMIRNDAELVSYIERVRYLRDIEMIFKDKKHCCLKLLGILKRIAEKSSLTRSKITVLPNQDGQIKEINNLCLDQEIVQRIKNIIRTKV
ncbi:transient receptor potential cation channel protein painless [Diabrotica virgifera virgifera]|uniref:Ion transport domain-containing protein n=1 Tax=Diabrotica virgifera virgifera TaxID=50390 RepID=A0ABM5IXB3_DIAVI|nr:transient receptor potential cation channel protein painless [Diabrotica virgifera virgifera]